jgi:hypothetical protein
MGVRGKMAAAALLLVGLSAFAYLVEIGQRFEWVATGLERHFPRDPEVPPFIGVDPTAPHWRTAVDVEQVRRDDSDVWTATGRVTVPTDAPALRRLRFQLGADVYALAGLLVGVAHLDGRPMRPTHYVITQHAGDGTAVLTFTATTTLPHGFASSVIVDSPVVTGGAQRTVTVTLADYDLTSVIPADVAEQTARYVEVHLPIRQGPKSVELSAVNARFRDPAFRSPATVPPLRALLLNTWTSVLGTVVWLVVYVLLGGRAFSGARYARRLRRVALAVIVLHLGGRLLALLGDATAWLIQVEPGVRSSELLLRAAFPGPDVALLALLCVAPLAALAWATDRPDRQGWWWAGCVALGCLLVGALGWLGVHGASRTVLLVTAAGTLAAAAVAGLVSRWVRLPVAPACAVVLLTSLLATLSPLATIRGWVPAAITLVPLVAGVAVATSILLALGRVAVHDAFGTKWPRVATVALVIVAVIAAAPQRDRAGDWFLAENAVFPLAPIGTLAIALGVAAALYVEIQAKSAGAAERVRRLGILFALLTFSSPAALVSYVPLVFLIGAPLITWWALPKPDGGAPAAVDDEEHAKNAAAVVRARAAERSADRLRRALRTKLEAGETTNAECEAQVRALEDVSAEARAGRPADLERATFGTYQFPPRQQAKYGALAGLVAGLPWVLLGAHGVVDAASFGPFPVLTFAGYAYHDLARWTAYGFVFGACFPLIRGRTGLAKGVTLFLTTAPLAVAVAFAVNVGTATEWARFAVAVAELFLHFMVLGLLADLSALNRAKRSGRGRSPHRYGMGRLVEIHNLRAVVAWSTSVSIALGTAVSSMIVSGATAFIVTMLPPNAAARQPTPPSSQQR